MGIGRGALLIAVAWRSYLSGGSRSLLYKTFCSSDSGQRLCRNALSEVLVIFIRPKGWPFSSCESSSPPPSTSSLSFFCPNFSLHAFQIFSNHHISSAESLKKGQPRDSTFTARPSDVEGLNSPIDNPVGNTSETRSRSRSRERDNEDVQGGCSCVIC